MKNETTITVRYYTLENGHWVHNSLRTLNFEGKRQIALYNQYLTFIGIGIY